MSPLLPCDVTRSEHDLEAAVAKDIAMHPVTGTFADSAHEAAFASQLFRVAYPVHLFLMALSLALLIWVALASPPELQTLWGMITLSVSLGLVGRALLHRMHDSARAQRLGSWTWAVLLMLAEAAEIGSLMMAPAAACELERKDHSAPLVATAIALINGSHGMPFVHKLALVGFAGLTKLLVATPAICQDSAVIAYEAGALILGAAVAHMVELHMRHNYAEKRRTEEDKRRLDEEKRLLEERNEQLQTSNERLMYDVQYRGRPLDDDDERSAIRRGLQAGPSPASDSDLARGPAPSDSAPTSLPPGPPSSSASSSSAPPQGADCQYFAEAAATPAIDDRVELVELSALAEMADDDAMHNLAVHHLIPAQANLQMASTMSVISSSMCCSAAQLLGGDQPFARPGRLYLQAAFNTQPDQQHQTHLPAAAASCSSISRPLLSGFSDDPWELYFIFAKLFTPKHPSTLPKAQWVSYTRMRLAVQPFAPARVWRHGPGNLKQLVVEWYQHHPAFAGLAQSAWCKRLADHDQQVLPGRSQPTCYKFCFEFTTAGGDQ